MVNEPNVKEYFIQKLMDGKRVHNDNVDIYLYGVLTEACILQTVLDLYKIKSEYNGIRNIFLIDDAV